MHFHICIIEQALSPLNCQAVSCFNCKCPCVTRVPTQVSSLFKPSSERDNRETTTTHTAPQAGGQPISYAEFIVQSKSRAKENPGHGPQSVDLPQEVFSATGQRSDLALECESITNPSTDTCKTSTKESNPDEVKAGSKKSGCLDDVLEQGQKTDEGQSTEERPVIPQAVGSGNSIIVSPRQVQECVK